jgi:hypothetical protein
MNIAIKDLDDDLNGVLTCRRSGSGLCSRYAAGQCDTDGRQIGISPRRLPVFHGAD